MVVDMKEVGLTTKQTVMESYITQMEISMKGIGRMIKQMVVVCIPMPMEPNTTESGKTTNNMEQVLRPGLMVLSMKVCILKERRMAEENSPSLMVQFMMENLK